MKRLIDIVLSLSALIILLPLMVGIAMLVYWDLGKPVFFRQQRPGLDRRPFSLVKFRTMSDESDEHGGHVADAKRLSRFGQWLRATSLDELPELWNVLTGDMSVVGPRPLLMEYLPLYSPEQNRRHEVRPGITGWAQVNGRNLLSWPEKLALDVWYVDNHTFFLDLKILALTVVRVLGRHGISQDGHATVEPFRGEQ